MNNNELIKGSELVLNFLLNSEEEFTKYKRFNTPSNENMMEYLNKFDLNIPQFTKKVNDRFKIIDGNIWEYYSFQQFFSYDISKKFFNIVIRQSKIKKLLNNGINNKRNIRY